MKKFKPIEQKGSLPIRHLKACLSVVFLVLGFQYLSAQQICSNQIGSQGGYTYEYWKDNGSGCMNLGSGGTFSVDWSNINNLLARKGLRPGSMNQTVSYGVNYQPNGNSYLCVYGWTTSPLVEYYIVESWGSWRPPGGQGYMGTVNSDGGTYDIYRTLRENQPSPQGNATFYQYWSVRTSKRTSGTVTCANHFNAWQSLGMNMGNLYEVSLTIEGYQSSGTADVYSMSMSTGGSSNDPPPPTGGSNTIVVRARGTSGGENIRVTVGGAQIGSWNLSTGYQNYTATTNSTGGINVEFTNDVSGRDVQVDYIQVNGSTRQAENQSTNTAVYQNGSCGGSNSEMMHCNGYIGFGNVTGGSNNPPPQPGGSTIVVRARGTNGSENIRLTVGGTQVGSWTLGTNYQNYTATTTNTGGINVEFTNDASGRDVQVDYIQVNGSTRQAESQSTNTAVYQNGSCGGSNSEMMHCNGYIGFGSAAGSSGARMGTIADVEMPNVNIEQDIKLFPNPTRDGNLTIDLGGLSGKSEINFTDMSGRSFKQIEVYDQPKVEIQLTATPGFYLMKLSNQKRMATKKFLVQE